MPRRRATTPLVAAVAVIILLSGCGGNVSGSDSSAAQRAKGIRYKTLASETNVGQPSRQQVVAANRARLHKAVRRHWQQTAAVVRDVQAQQRRDALRRVPGTRVVSSVERVCVGVCNGVVLQRSVRQVQVRPRVLYRVGFTCPRRANVVCIP